MTDVRSILNHLPCQSCTYEEWLKIGMALRHEGYDVTLWEEWSRQDPRYRAGECREKWASFTPRDIPVTAGTIAYIANQHHCMPKETPPTFARKAGIGRRADRAGTAPRPVPAPAGNPVDDLIQFFTALFDPEEYVGCVSRGYMQDGRIIPEKGRFDRKAGELLFLLKNCNGDLRIAFGNTDPAAGAWVRVNPLDGQGVRDENVTAFRHVLVECDDLPLDEQYARILALNLPVVTLTHSGKKSLHAICRVDAKDAAEYRERVAFLYDYCERSGLKVDRACKNPSRLSRLPGFQRGESWQYLIATHIGAPDYETWRASVEQEQEAAEALLSEPDLPEIEHAADFWNDLPPLKDELIGGILRQGHKLLLAGPSKAGKSFSLIALTLAIAGGGDWFGFPCAKGKVLYVNLELDDASAKHRFIEVYDALHAETSDPDDLSVLDNIDIWNLRGHSLPMDRLTPAMIRRAKEGQYTAIIIDPIYKVITGDENSAEQMAHFCDQFDRICAEAGCAVIYCHHHSKGAQGAKRSMDRASGSGVFARDPDALLDLIELEVPDETRTLLKNKEAERTMRDFMQDAPDASEMPENSRSEALRFCQDRLSREEYEALQRLLTASDREADMMTAWRLEGTLREFPRFVPRNYWFRYPVHVADETGILEAMQPDLQTYSAPYYRAKGNQTKSKMAKSARAEKMAETINAFERLNQNGEIGIQELADELQVTTRTIERRLKNCNELILEKGIIKRAS